MKKKIKVTVYNRERYDGEWPPEEAAPFIQWFQAKVDSVPAEHRAGVKIELDSEGGYEGSHSPRIEISYWREETDAECEKRLNNERQRQAQRETEERQAYERLRAKYER